MRRLALLAIVVPYCAWFWPQWAARDIAEAFMRGVRARRRKMDEDEIAIKYARIIAALRDLPDHEPDPGWQERVMTAMADIDKDLV